MGFNPLKAIEHAAGSVAHAVGDAAEEGGKAFEGAMKDAEQAAKHMSLSDLGHTALDVASFVPGLGTVTGFVNAGWYAAEGDWKDAALSAATAIPIAGDFVDAAKVGKDAITIGKDVETAVKLGEDATKAAEDGTKVAKGATDTARAGSETSAATNVADGVRLKNQLSAQEIAGGHAFEKHVLGVGNPQGSEFVGLGIRTRNQFAEHIENVINNPTQSSPLTRGREYFYDGTTNTIVIRNPRAADGGTAFRPVDPERYLRNLR
jgi:filamentous hemagglutinin